MTKTPHYNRILVTGANGRLGRLLRGAATTRDPDHTQAIFAARNGPADLAFSAQSIPKQLPQCGAVLALWGVTSGSEDDLAQNTALVDASVNVARACGASRVFHMSSAAVYGPGEDLVESSPTTPANAYGHAKLEMELHVAQLPVDNLHHCCLRLANVVGADSLAPALRASGSAPVTLTRFANQTGPLRSYVSATHLFEIITALAALPASNLPPVLNVAASSSIEMEALARAASKAIAWKPETPDDRQVVTLSTARLAALLPDLTLSKSAQDMIRDWQTSERLA